MAIAEVFTYSPRPGGIEQFLSLAKRADKILRALGATTRTMTSVPNWKTHGELSAKLEADADWRKFLADVNSNDKPAVDLISSAVYAEIPLG